MKLWRLIAIALLITVALILGVVVLAVVNHLLMGAVSRIPGLGWMQGWSGIAVLIVGWILLPERFKAVPIAYDIRGTTLIDASGHRIWQLMRPTAGAPYFLSSVTEVREVAGEPDRLDLQFDTRMTNEGHALMVRVEEEEPLSYLRLGYLNAEVFPLWSKDLVSTEQFMERENGLWRVTHIDHLDKLRISTVLALLFLNPSRDGLSRLKALSEGTADPSWMGRMSAGIGPDGSPPAGVTRSIRVVGITAAVVLTAFTFGLLWVIANLAGS